MTESRGKGFDLEAIGAAIVIGFFSRFIGALARSVLILIGLATLAVELVSIVAVYAFWLTAPFLIIVLFIWGFLFIF